MGVCHKGKWAITSGFEGTRWTLTSCQTPSVQFECSATPFVDCGLEGGSKLGRGQFLVAGGGWLHAGQKNAPHMHALVCICSDDGGGWGWGGGQSFPKGGGGLWGEPPPGHCELLEAPKAQNKIFGLN